MHRYMRNRADDKTSCRHRLNNTGCEEMRNSQVAAYHRPASENIFFQ